MLNFDDLSLTDPRDPRLKLIVEMLAKSVYREAEVSAILESCGSEPGRLHPGQSEYYMD